jgi:hypothetical protein
MNIMTIIFVFLACVYGGGVQASNLSTVELEDQENRAPPSKRACASCTNEDVRTQSVLKHKRHSLRMQLLNRARTPSISPPCGERRRKLEDDLSCVERALKQAIEQPKHKPS